MGSDPIRLREGVREAYSRAATCPADAHPFPVGEDFARSLGYPPELLRQIPRASLDSFSGVSNVSIFAVIPPGATVVDLGCGSGLDSLIAAQRTGAAGRVIGLDFSLPMLQRAICSKRQASFTQLGFIQSAAEHLPLGAASADQALVNGIFNLKPFRDRIFSELARVLKPGGTVFGAELLLAAPLDADARANPGNWFS